MRLGGLPQTQQPALAILGKRLGTEDLCQIAGGGAADQVHLPEAIGSGHVALSHHQVVQR